MKVRYCWVWRFLFWTVTWGDADVGIFVYDVKNKIIKIIIIFEICRMWWKIFWGILEGYSLFYIEIHYRRCYCLRVLVNEMWSEEETPTWRFKSADIKIWIHYEYRSLDIFMCSSEHKPMGFQIKHYGYCIW